MWVSFWVPQMGVCFWYSERVGFLGSQGQRRVAVVAFLSQQGRTRGDRPQDQPGRNVGLRVPGRREGRRVRVR